MAELLSGLICCDTCGNEQGGQSMIFSPGRLVGMLLVAGAGVGAGIAIDKIAAKKADEEVAA